MKKPILAFILLGTMLAYAREDRPRSIMGPQDFKPEDVAIITNVANALNEYGANIQSLNRELELTKTKLELNQAKLQRINEVVLPTLINQLRTDYKLLPESDWKFDLKTFTFVKQSLSPDPPK